GPSLAMSQATTSVRWRPPCTVTSGSPWPRWSSPEPASSYCAACAASGTGRKCDSRRWGYIRLHQIPSVDTPAFRPGRKRKPLRSRAEKADPPPRRIGVYPRVTARFTTCRARLRAMTRTVKRAFKYRFYPTDAQAAELARTFGCVRKVYNLALAARTVRP